MNKISSGLLMLLAAGGLAVFWANGYLAKWTGDIAGRVGGDVTKTPIVLPGVYGPDERPRPGIAPVPPVRPIGGIA